VAILERLFHLYGEALPDLGLMPMTISWLGNSSVATVPTLLDLLLQGQLPGHQVQPGDHVVLASVGAGMNINAVVYRF
jgi:3-oxoacyl-[acyl-carrier-protein] synthase-3